MLFLLNLFPTMIFETYFNINNYILKSLHFSGKLQTDHIIKFKLYVINCKTISNSVDPIDILFII